MRGGKKAVRREVKEAGRSKEVIEEEESEREGRKTRQI